MRQLVNLWLSSSDFTDIFILSGTFFRYYTPMRRKVLTQGIRDQGGVRSFNRPMNAETVALVAT